MPKITNIEIFRQKQVSLSFLYSINNTFLNQLTSFKYTSKSEVISVDHVKYISAHCRNLRTIQLIYDSSNNGEIHTTVLHVYLDDSFTSLLP